VSFITFLTAGVMSMVIRRANAAAEEEERTKQENRGHDRRRPRRDEAAIADLEQPRPDQAKLPS
jgi:hypothetical protein